MSAPHLEETKDNRVDDLQGNFEGKCSLLHCRRFLVISKQLYFMKGCLRIGRDGIVDE
ncbi:hypothetical protein HPP92_016882 [Vanilla planifolia]|uniref:Uncharacterized protein n=1 Tax=Vanilla planifolia TaxID=51239 RepID=A0A835QK17_VANPL|nr:hypothetical protein HPP92_016882 [Vanilla planifolia]